MKFIYLLISISFFSCSNRIEKRNAKLSEFLIKQRNLQIRLDSINQIMASSMTVDTYAIIENDPLGILQVSPEVSEEQRKSEEIKDLKILLISELNSLRFSMDSLSQMK